MNIYNLLILIPIKKYSPSQLDGPDDQKPPQTPLKNPLSK